MNFMKLVQSIESALFELCLWLLMWPKTLWQTARRPAWVHDYVDQESAKGSDDQYDGYMSPALFMAVSVLGWLLSLDLVDDTLLTSLSKALGAKEASFDHKFGVLIGAAMLLPMVFALVSTRAEKLEMTRKSIHISFSKHAYTTAAFWGLLLVCGFAVLVLAVFLPETIAASLAVIAPLACMLWFCWAQCRLFADELKVSPFKGFRLAFFAGSMWLMIVMLVLAVAFGATTEQSETGAGSDPATATETQTSPTP